MKTSNKQKIKAAATAIAIATLSGCVTGPDALTGTVLGGVAGAATGGIIGHQKGKGLEGAAIGGGIGAIAGNLLGSASDQRNYNTQQRNPVYRQEPQYYQQPRPQYQQPYYQQQPRYYPQSYQSQQPQYDVYRSRTVIITRDNDDCNQYNNNYGYNNRRSNNPYYDDYAYGAPPSRDARSNGGLYNASNRYNNNNYSW